MKKLIIAAVAAAAFTAPAMAAEPNLEHPKSLQEYWDCVKIQFSGDEVPDACKTVGQRLRDRLAAED